jgi:hypothetical protein
MISRNAGLGIDLAEAGVTLNDSGDPDVGPNNVQNFPVFTSAFTTVPPVPPMPVTIVTGSLNAAPNTAYTLEFFTLIDPDPSGFGEGDFLLGRNLVTTDASGNASFTFPFPAQLVGTPISATATDPVGNTSEFSEVIRVEEGGPVIVTIEALDAAAAEAGPDSGIFRLTRTGNVDPTEPLQVRVSFSGTATPGTDYDDPGEFVIIPIARLSVDVIVTPVLDAAVEGNETVIMTVEAGLNYQPGTQNTATIVIGEAPPPIPGDLDGDADVDRQDLTILLAARNTPASGPTDPRDLDGDGRITVLDARKLVGLFTRPGGATQ